MSKVLRFALPGALARGGEPEVAFCKGQSWALLPMPHYGRQRDPMTDFGLFVIGLASAIMAVVWLADRA